MVEKLKCNTPVTRCFGVLKIGVFGIGLLDF